MFHSDDVPLGQKRPRDSGQHVGRDKDQAHGKYQGTLEWIVHTEYFSPAGLLSSLHWNVDTIQHRTCWNREALNHI